MKSVKLELPSRHKQRLLWSALICTLAVALYYIPLPLATYPETVEERRVYFDSFKITSLGVMPALTAVLWISLFRLARGDRTSAAPLLDPLDRKTLLVLVPIATVMSIQYAQGFGTNSSPPLWTNILIPAVSLIGGVFLQIYLATLIDRWFKGWGFWTLSTAVSVSYIWFGASEWIDKFRVGAANGSELFLMGTQFVLCACLAVLAVSVFQKQGRSDERNLFLMAACIVAAQYWLIVMIDTFLLNREDIAYFVSEHERLIKNIPSVLVLLFFGALFVGGALARRDLGGVVALFAVLCICGLDLFGLANSLQPIIFPHDFLILAVASSWLLSFSRRTDFPMFRERK
jgi:hypothetical protein